MKRKTVVLDQVHCQVDYEIKVSMEVYWSILLGDIRLRSEGGRIGHRDKVTCIEVPAILWGALELGWWFTAVSTEGELLYIPATVSHYLRNV